MADENKKQKLEDKMEKKEEVKHAGNKEEVKKEMQTDNKQIVENKDKKETKKEEKKKKEEAIARGVSLRASKKHCMYICSFIKGKNIDKAIEDLEEVLMFKRPIPFKGEIPHRKGKIMSGRYPVKVSAMMINVLK